jgi:hypothetical protein
LTRTRIGARLAAKLSIAGLNTITEQAVVAQAVGRRVHTDVVQLIAGINCAGHTVAAIRGCSRLAGTFHADLCPIAVGPIIAVNIRLAKWLHVFFHGNPDRLRITQSP